MAVLLNGTSQYITLGNGVDVLSTRPITLAALINSASLRTTGSYNSIFSQGTYASRGWGVEVSAETSPKVYSSLSHGLGNDESTSSWTLTANTGWWLIMWTARDIGSNNAYHFYGYRYNTRAYAFGTTGGGGDTDDVPTAIDAADPTVIGGFNDAGVIDFYPGGIAWVAVWNYDLSAGGNAASPHFNRLIKEGAWSLQDGLYKPRLFVPLASRYNLHDIGPMKRTGTAVAGLTWAGSPLTEDRPRVFEVQWLVPQVAAGEEYTKTVAFAAPVTLAAPDSITFTETTSGFSPVRLSGADEVQITETSTLLSPAILAAPDTIQLTETSALLSPVVLQSDGDIEWNKTTALLSPVILQSDGDIEWNKATSLLSPVVLASVDSVQITETATLASPVVLSGPDSLDITTNSTLAAPVVLAGADSLTFTETSALLSPVILSAVGSAVEEYTKTAAFFAPVLMAATDTLTLTESAAWLAPVTLSASDELVLTETAALLAPVTLAATESLTFTETASLLSPVTLDATDSITFTETSSLLSPVTLSASDELTLTEAAGLFSPVILATGDSTEVYTVTAAFFTPVILATPDSLTFTETGGLFTPVVLSAVAVVGSAGGGGSTQWVPIGYDDVLYNQELQKTGERDKLAARRAREKRDEQDLIDLFIIL